MNMLLTRTQARILRAIVLFLSKDGKWIKSAGGADVVVESVSSLEWSSLTFTGMRHHFAIRLPAGAAPIDLDGARLAVSGAVVAIERAAWTVGDTGPRLTVDLLAIDDNETPSWA